MEKILKASSINKQINYIDNYIDNVTGIILYNGHTFCYWGDID